MLWLLHSCLDCKGFLWIGRGRKRREDNTSQLGSLEEEQCTSVNSILFQIRCRKRSYFRSKQEFLSQSLMPPWGMLFSNLTTVQSTAPQQKRYRNQSALTGWFTVFRLCKSRTKYSAISAAKCSFYRNSHSCTMLLVNLPVKKITGVFKSSSVKVSSLSQPSCLGILDYMWSQLQKASFLPDPVLTLVCFSFAIQLPSY